MYYGRSVSFQLFNMLAVCASVTSLCTTLCLQWEPEIIAVAVMYLTSRLTKFDITDWQGKPSGYRGKWYEFIVEDVTLELLEGMSSVHCRVDLKSELCADIFASNLLPYFHVHTKPDTWYSTLTR